MFFILSKLLSFLISPFYWLLGSLCIYFFAKKPNWKKWSKISAIVIVLFFSNSFFYLEFCRMWEVHSKPIDELEKYEIGIVLSGMGEYNNDIKTFSIRRGGDRIWQAITLYKKGKIKKILISGGSGFVFDRGLEEAKQLKEVLVSWGIPEKDLISENISRNTHENALESKKIIERSYPHVEKCLLITSGRHMRRAKACFDKQDLKVDVYSTDLYTGPNRNLFWDQYFIPNVQNFENWEGLIKEWVGFVSYKISGYI
jgi:uncharacterized SAM-binding protein YcdF (DUF218 family)